MKCSNCLIVIEGQVWSFSYNNPSDGSKVAHYCSLNCYYDGLNHYIKHVKNLLVPVHWTTASANFMTPNFGTMQNTTSVLYMNGDAIDTEPTPEIKQIEEVKIPKAIFEKTDILNADELTEIMQLAHLNLGHAEVTKNLSDISYPKIEITKGIPLNNDTATKLAHFKFKTIFDVILIKIAENSIKSHYQQCNFHEVDVNDNYHYSTKFPIINASANYIEYAFVPSDVLETLNSRSVMKNDFLKSAPYLDLIISELDNILIEIQGDFPNLNIKIHDRVYKLNCSSFIKPSVLYNKFKEDILEAINPHEIYVEDKFDIKKSVAISKSYINECNVHLFYDNHEKVYPFKKALIQLLEFHTKTA